MTKKDSPTVMHFREFVNASTSLYRALSANDPVGSKELLEAILFALRSVVDEVFQDTEIIRTLDEFVVEKHEFRSVIAETWANFVIALGFVHLKRYSLSGSEESVKRARHFSHLVEGLVERDTNSSVWAVLQVLKGDCDSILSPFWFESRHNILYDIGNFFDSGFGKEDVKEYFTHYQDALEVTSPDENPDLWVGIASRLGRAYETRQVGDEVTNLHKASDIFAQIGAVCERIGSVSGSLEAYAYVLVNQADLRVVSGSNQSDIEHTLRDYKEAIC